MLVFCSLALGFLGKRLCFVVRCLLSVEKCLLCSEARALAAECSEKLPIATRFRGLRPEAWPSEMRGVGLET